MIKAKNVFDDDNIGNIPQFWSYMSLVDSFVILNFISLHFALFSVLRSLFFFGLFFGFFFLESCINFTFFTFLFFWS